MNDDRHWRDRAPDHRAHADITAPGHPSIAECNPAAVQWRGLRIDPDLAGLVPGRAHARSIEVVHAGGSPWTLPVTRVLATPLAWHPDLPLVAGLTVGDDRRAMPWVADYAARTVTVRDGVRACTGLTGYGYPPLAWCDGVRLAMLVPPASEATRPPPVSGVPKAKPVVLEATGPRHLTFAAGIDELEALAAVRVAVLNPDGDAGPLTRPMLVRSLRLASSGAFLDLEYAEDDPNEWTEGEWGDDESEYGLRWGHVRAQVPGGGRSHPRRASLSLSPRKSGTSADRSPAGITTLDPPRAGSRGASAQAPPRIATVPTGFADAVLTIFPSPGRTTSGPTVLWISACEPGSRAAAVPPPTITSAGYPVAHLDLPIHWPSDATVELLHVQIVKAVRGAVLALQPADAPAPDVVVGGHSFGATLALYALAHVRDLAAAIAHSGCYNRTLTPTGFMYEKRSYWDAPDIYQAFSAHHFADRLDRPVLLAHGVDDANPATPPDQAVGLYRAIVAAGGHARLVLLPHEGHNLYYRETQRAVLDEHRTWLARCTRVADRC